MLNPRKTLSSRSAYESWIFDLDHTLYPPSANLFELIAKNMTEYIRSELDIPVDEAELLRISYWERYGNTLTGLIAEHGVDPTPYLTWVHDIPLDSIDENLKLRSALEKLNGKRIVFTNGPSIYAKRVIDAIGLSGIFSKIYGLDDSSFQPKPDSRGFDTIISKAEVRASKSIFFDDDRRNLVYPKSKGMTTVLVSPEWAKCEDADFVTNDLAAFLSGLVD